MQSKWLTALSLSALVLLALPARADRALATAKNCMTCHAMDRKLVGPAFKDVAARYRNDKAAADRLAQKIMEGGGGAWGVVRMPSNPQVNEAEAKRLAAWTLSQ
jgi:cytochrome c